MLVLKLLPKVSNERYFDLSRRGKYSLLFKKNVYKFVGFLCFQSVYVVIAFQFFGRAYSEFHQTIWQKEKTFNIRILGNLG